MSDSNIRRVRPQTSHYSNNYHSSRVSDEADFPCFLGNNHDVEKQLQPSSSYQASPLPMFVPSHQLNEFNSQNQYFLNTRQESNQRSRNDRPFYHMETHLSYRRWSQANNQNNIHSHQNQYFKFHIVCYNILSQLLLEDNRFLYANCFNNNIKWYKRKERLLRELLRQDADILCLQEMENYHYEHDFRPILMEHGYYSIYVKRTGDKSDGCSIFYKTNRLKLIASKAVPFYQRHIPLLDRDNCGLIALFQPNIPNVSPDDLFCVATTHLLFSPKRGDIKLAQIQYFLAEIDLLATKDPFTNSYFPIILCGDFNAQPQSPLIQFLLNQYIKYDSYRCIDISGQTTDLNINNRFSYQLPSNELIPSSFVTSNCRFPSSNDGNVLRTHINTQPTAMLTHNKQLRTVYDLNNSSDVTSHAGGESNLVDYIFYTEQDDDPDRLTLLSYYGLYKKDQMIDIHMPNHQFPSDHFLLAAKFAIRLRKGNIK